jgi:hypothetical protein
MSEDEYLKCPCKECGNNIEYPADAARSTIACPHCGEWTELPAPKDESEAEPAARSLFGVIVLVLLPLAAVAGGAYFLLEHSKPADPVPKAPLVAHVSKPVAQPPVAPAIVVSNPPPVAEPTNPPAPAEKRPKAASDLVVGRVSLDKTKGTGLVHAVGTVKNNSDYERFRVKITVDLINKQGVKIGSAEDQKSVIEPHENWKFRALVADRQAASAVVASVTEE